MKIKYLFFIFIVCFLVGCNKSNQVLSINTSSELNEEYHSIDELKNESNLIVEGRVHSQEVIVYEGLPFTVSEFHIINNYKGDISKGDVISVIETGGIYKPELEQGVFGDKVEMKLNGVKVMDSKDDYILFLKTFSGPQLANQGYIPLGAYQGKFKIVESTIKTLNNQEPNIQVVEQQADEEYKMKNIPVNKEELITTIRSAGEKANHDIHSNVTNLKEQFENQNNISEVEIDPEDKVFHPDLLGVTPTVLKIQDVELVTFELYSEEDIAAAVKAFEERTATMEITNFYELYNVNNLLIFIVSDDINQLKKFENKYNSKMEKVYR
ncbi:hypothetical protein MKZ26_16445 [Sporosarcina sp. FSL K6-6792]|uniref:hypothetical protein n=1 Tax=Sporosarcina sp. FSL K6-6792 TaxID=2921559 RepID=UPI0030FABF71